MLKSPVLDPTEDRQLSQSAPWENDVVHVINDNFLGIRAAVSAFPGHKLVLPNLHWHFREHLTDALSMIETTKATRIVVHGMSNATYEVARAVHQRLPSVTVYGVWHGGPSQWVSHHEAVAFARFLEFDSDGVYARSHIMKPGCNAVLRSPSTVDLMNCAPRDRLGPAVPTLGTVLVPAPASLHKNVYGNLVAAELSTRVRQILHYMQLAEDPLPLSKATHVSYAGPLENQKIMASCEVVLNASTMDCHPMVDLEAAAVGRPSLHMRLGFPVLDAHPLGELATIEDAGSIASIQQALERVLDVDLKTRTELALDYAATATKAGTAALESFIYA